MNRPEFEQLVADALASIPRRFRQALSNIAIVVEDEPSAQLLHEMEIEPPDTLFGLYQGTPLTERHWGYGNALPDRILLFQGPLERDSEDDDDLVVAIGETLIHEIGHYFGMSEEEIEEIEERYWRGGATRTKSRTDACDRRTRGNGVAEALHESRDSSMRRGAVSLARSTCVLHRAHKCHSPASASASIFSSARGSTS